ncbi:Alpha/beta-Hydrolases superfamily protein [Hibiscus syriacus]|uniref:Alpha/beta-Hydrolases superfamily protein n=1 Tax=Hibiscus syriacus TaxID=106335 RepID=A0A6A3D8D3_HIBSY|nr:Alpha/beta-Hydrolases superfamily protein [Hibiscus syriacus]
MDLQRIESRLDKGVYSECSTKFFRDLLLLFNIIGFHRKSSPERTAAEQLRALVLKEMNHKLPKQDDSSKPSKSSTMVPCGKRTSSKAVIKDGKERVVEEKQKANEKKIDASPFAATNTTLSKSGDSNHEYGGNELSSHDAVELKVDTKKENNKARKKQGAASFLKRMKQNSISSFNQALSSVDLWFDRLQLDFYGSYSLVGFKSMVERRGRPQKPLKDETEEEVEKLDGGGKNGKADMTADERKSPPSAENRKKRKRTSQVKEKADSIKEENGLGTRSSTDELSKSNGFRKMGVGVKASHIELLKQSSNASEVVAVIAVCVFFFTWPNHMMR